MSKAARVLLFGDGMWAEKTLRAMQASVAGLVARTAPSDPSLLACAREMGLPVYQPANVNAPEFVETVRRIAPDINLSISYNQIFRRAIRETATLGFLNIHASKLPRYRGRNVINWAIINGETEIGITAHLVDDGIDTGDIVLQRTLPIGWTDTYGDVLARVVDAIPDIACEAVDLIATGQARPVSQTGVGLYVGGREPGDEWLDWSDTSLHLYNKIRAITRPAPGARTVLGGEAVTIWRAQYDPSWPAYIATPGQVIGRDASGSLVKTGDSALLVTEVETIGGVCGAPSWKIGTRLGIDVGRELLARLSAAHSTTAR